MHFYTCQILLFGASLLFSTTNASIHHEFKHKRQGELTTVTASTSSTETLQLSAVDSASPSSSEDSAASITDIAAASTTDDSAASSTIESIDSSSTPLFQSHPVTTTTASFSNSSITATETPSNIPVSPSDKASTKTEQTTLTPSKSGTASGAVTTSTPKSLAGKTLDARGWCVLLSVVFGAWGVIGLMFGLGVGGWL